MKSYSIGVIGGDGIGPEVAAEGLKVLTTAARLHGIQFEFVEYPYSGAHYLKTRELVPERVIDEWRNLDAVFLGAIGHPDVEPGLVERSVIMGLRFGLDLYVNLRPVKLYAEHLCPLKGKSPADVDFAVVRENTEDAYAGLGGIFKKGTQDEVAIAEMVFTRKGTERIIRYAFELARERAGVRRIATSPRAPPGARSGEGSPPLRRPRVTMVDKANAIRAQDLWTRTFAEVGAEYPDVEQDHAYVDACCMWMVKNPDWYDVIVTTNLFGDIITDLGAMIQGGMGIAASGNLHPGKHGMFEPIHGSAPRYAGKNVASPLGAISAAAMMLDFLGEGRAAAQIEAAVAGLLSSGAIPSIDARSGLSTTQVGDMVVAEILNVTRDT